MVLKCAKMLDQGARPVSNHISVISRLVAGSGTAGRDSITCSNCVERTSKQWETIHYLDSSR